MRRAILVLRRRRPRSKRVPDENTNNTLFSGWKKKAIMCVCVSRVHFGNIIQAFPSARICFLPLEKSCMTNESCCCCIVSLIVTAQKKKNKNRFPSDWPLTFSRGLKCYKWEITIPLHVGHFFWPRAAEASWLPYKSEMLGTSIWDIRSPKWTEWERGRPSSTFCTFCSLPSPSVGDLQRAIGQFAADGEATGMRIITLMCEATGTEGERKKMHRSLCSELPELKLKDHGDVGVSCTSGPENTPLECSAAISGKPSAQLNKSTDQWQYTGPKRVEFCNNACLSIIAIFHPPGN